MNKVFLGTILVAIVIAGAYIGVSRLVLGQDSDPSVNLGDAKPGMKVYEGFDVKVEYPSDWTQGVGDFGSIDRYGVLLISPKGSEGFIDLTTKEVEVVKSEGVDAAAISELQNNGVKFKVLPRPTEGVATQ